MCFNVNIVEGYMMFENYRSLNVVKGSFLFLSDNELNIYITFSRFCNVYVNFWLQLYVYIYIYIYILYI